jgi:hypothetical protein
MFYRDSERNNGTCRYPLVIEGKHCEYSMWKMSVRQQYTAGSEHFK